MSEDTTSISDLMARDPLSLTKEDRKPIIEYYRSNRERFASFATFAPLAKPPKVKADVPELDLDLGDLG